MVFLHFSLRAGLHLTLSWLHVVLLTHVCCIGCVAIAACSCATAFKVVPGVLWLPGIIAVVAAVAFAVTGNVALVIVDVVAAVFVAVVVFVGAAVAAAASDFAIVMFVIGLVAAIFCTLARALAVMAVWSALGRAGSGCGSCGGCHFASCSRNVAVLSAC